MHWLPQQAVDKFLPPYTNGLSEGELRRQKNNNARLVSQITKHAYVLANVTAAAS